MSLRTPLLVEIARAIRSFEVDCYEKPTQVSMSLETRDALVEEARIYSEFIPEPTPEPHPADMVMGLPIVLDDDLPYEAFVVEGDNR